MGSIWHMGNQSWCLHNSIFITCFGRAVQCACAQDSTNLNSSLCFVCCCCFSIVWEWYLRLPCVNIEKRTVPQAVTARNSTFEEKHFLKDQTFPCEGNHILNKRSGNKTPRIDIYFWKNTVMSTIYLRRMTQGYSVFKDKLNS